MYSMSTVGCRNLHAVKMTNEKTEEYDSTSKSFPIVKSIDINPNTYEDKNAYNDIIGEVVSGISSLEVAINTKDLTPEDIAYFFGAEKDSNGVYVYNSNHKPITCALMFESLLSDQEHSRYTCIYKCKPQLPKESYKSKVENGVEFQDKQIIFTCTPLKNGDYKAQVDSTDDTAKTAISKWYTAPYKTT